MKQVTDLVQMGIARLTIFHSENRMKPLAGISTTNL